MIIGQPRLLLGLLVLIPVIGLQIRAFVVGRRDLLALGSHLDPGRLSSLFLVKWFLTAFSFDVFIVFAVLATAGITWGQVPVEEDRSGLDVVVALDVSRSMLASDVEPSRMDRATTLVRGLRRDLSLARFAIVVFKGAATTVMPLTADAYAIEIVLEGVSPAMVSSPGTSIAAGLSYALDRFPSSSSAHRAVVIISDGEDQGGDPRAGIARARDLGIPVFSVLAGTAAGAVVPAPDGTAMTDDNDRPVISRADPRVLESIATSTGGRMFELADPDVTVSLVSELSRFAVLRQEEGFRLVPHRRFRFFLVVAVISLAVSLILRVIRWRRLF